MHPPPFRLALVPPLDREAAGPMASSAPSGAYRPLADLCCAPSEVKPAVRRRARLADLDSFLHCSLIGTCLSTTELRKLVPRYTSLDRQHSSDVEIHHAAVQLATEGGPGRKALQKTLDERYAGAVRRFDSAKDEGSLLALWKEALKNGDIPPAYWAVMTHPHATFDVRQAAFGDVHMLSHLVGAANRADIRRLMQLEENNAELRSKIERQQARLLEMSVQRDRALRELAEKSASQAAGPETPVLSDTGLYAEVLRLRRALADNEQRLALHASRQEAADLRSSAEQEKAQALEKRLEAAQTMLQALQAETRAAEQAIQLSGESQNYATAMARLAGRRVLYVGGRPGTHTVLRGLVEASGAQFQAHDGGIEDRKGLLATALSHADLVVFPVDCIDHDSMSTVKRLCDRGQVAYYPLRTASIACFLEWVMRLHGDTAPAGRPVSRFCIRHG